jgi:hypothetical protein
MKVAIWGSCVSRDAFGLCEHPFDQIAYFARSSWISQASRPVALDLGMPAGYAQSFGGRVVGEDLDKTIVERLVASEPDVVVIDLIDERFDVVQVEEGAWITASTYLGQSDFGRALRHSGLPRMTPSSPERPAAFDAAVGSLAGRLLDLPADVPVVLHCAWFTVLGLDGEPAFAEDRYQYAHRHNVRLAAYATAIRDALGDRAVLLLPRDDMLRADPDHQWGLDHFHYGQAYYDEFLAAIVCAAEGRDHPLLQRGGEIRPPGAMAALAKQAWRRKAAAARAESGATGATGTAASARGWRRTLGALAPAPVRSWYRGRRAGSG